MNDKYGRIFALLKKTLNYKKISIEEIEELVNEQCQYLNEAKKSSNYFMENNKMAFQNLNDFKINSFIGIQGNYEAFPIQSSVLFDTFQEDEQAK